MSKPFISLLIITLLILLSKSEEIKEVFPYENYHLILNKEKPIEVLKFRLNNSNEEKGDLIIHFQSGTGFTVKGLVTLNLEEVNCILENNTCSNYNNSIKFILQRKDFIVKTQELNLKKENEFIYFVFKDKHYFYEDYVSIYKENDDIEIQENQPYLLSRFFSLNYRICTFKVKEKNKYSFEINNYDKDLVTIYTNKTEYKEIYSSNDNLIETVISLFPNKTYYIKITNMRKEKRPYYKNKFLILITKFEGFKPLELKEGQLHFEKFVTFNKYFFYFDITNYKLNEENYVTYRFDSINENINNEIKAVIVTSNETNITDYKQLIPVKDSKSIFSLVESHKFKDNVYHLKFSKTIQKPNQRTLLFIALKFSPKNLNDTFIYPDDFEIGVGKRMDLKYLEEQNFKYNDQWIEHNDNINENSIPHFYKFILNDTNHNIYNSDKEEKSIIIQSGNGTKVKIQTEKNSTLIKEKLSDNTILLRMKNDKFLTIKVEPENKYNKKNQTLSFKIFYTNHTIHNLIKPENLKLLNENSPLLNDDCINQSYIITNEKIKHFIPSFNVELLFQKYYLTSIDNNIIIDNPKEFIVRDKNMIPNLPEDLNINQLNCKSIVIFNQYPIQVNSFKNLINDYSFTIKKDILLSYDKFLLNLKQMDGNKTKEHKFEINYNEINNNNLNNNTLNENKEEFTQLIGKNISEGIYRVEITGYGKKSDKKFIEKYKPKNIQIRNINIEEQKNGFSINYFVILIFIISVTLLILLGVIRENKTYALKKSFDDYIETTDEED